MRFLMVAYVLFVLSACKTTSESKGDTRLINLLNENKTTNCGSAKVEDICPTVRPDIIEKCGSCPMDLIVLHQKFCAIQGLAIGDLKQCYSEALNLSIVGQKVFDNSGNICRELIRKYEPSIQKAITSLMDEHSKVQYDPQRWINECIMRDWAYLKCTGSKKKEYKRVENGEYRITNVNVINDTCQKRKEYEGLNGKTRNVYVKHDNGYIEIKRSTDEDGDQTPGYGSGFLECDEANIELVKKVPVARSAECESNQIRHAVVKVKSNKEMSIMLTVQNREYIGNHSRDRCETIPPCISEVSFDLKSKF